MKNTKICMYHAVYGLACYLFSFASLALAVNPLGEAIDCTKVNVDYISDPKLSREERLRLMDKALLKSLNKFEMCRSAEEKGKGAASANGANAGTEGNGDFSGGSGNEGESVNNSNEMSVATDGTTVETSVPSSTMSGTEIAPESRPAVGVDTDNSDSLQGGEPPEEKSDRRAGDIELSNGKIPEDIPSAKNDDTLAAQIRSAAENEPDPVKSRQLWNEYRKYRGLAPQ